MIKKLTPTSRHIVYYDFENWNYKNGAHQKLIDNEWGKLLEQKPDVDCSLKDNIDVFTKFINKHLFNNFLNLYRSNYRNEGLFEGLEMVTIDGAIYQAITIDYRPNVKDITLLFNNENILNRVQIRLRGQSKSKDIFRYLALSNSNGQLNWTSSIGLDTFVVYESEYIPSNTIKFDSDFILCLNAWVKFGEKVFRKKDITTGGEFSFIKEDGNSYGHLDEFDVTLKTDKIRNLCMGGVVDDKARTYKAIQQLMKWDRSDKKNIDVGLITKGHRTNYMNLKRVIITLQTLQKEGTFGYPADKYIDNINQNYKSEL